MSTRIIVVGTGTGIGKTHVACALLRASTGRGMPAAGLKPIETGLGAAANPSSSGASRSGSVELAGSVEATTDDPSSPAGDQGLLWRAAQGTLPDGTFHVKQALAFHVKRPLYGFPDPVSPHLAARRAGIRIDLAKVRQWVSDHSQLVTVIETAGGLFSPLDEHTTNLDLVAALLPARVLLVAPDRLGVLHDLTATLGFARALDRAPDGVVLSAPEVPDASTGENAAALGSLGIASPLTCFPRAPDDAPPSLACAARVLDWLAR